MKVKWKIIVPVLVVVALAGIFGGHALMKQQEAKAAELKAQQEAELNTPASPSPSVAPVEEVIYTLPPIPSSTPKPTPKPDGTPAEGTTTKEPDGTIVITPDFEDQASHAVKIVKPGSQVEANMGSGGGDLELGEDGAFHGTPPTPAPAVTQHPGSIQSPAGIPSPAPTAAPVTSTPAPAESSTPETSPSPDPSQGSQEPQDGPPSRKGAYDGEISPDGKYEWWDIGSGEWVERGGSNGGDGGDLSIYDEHLGEGLSGNKVGNM